MPDGDDIRNLVNQARMQNQEFMMQARQQMVQQLEAQRYQIAQSAGPAGAAAVTGMGYPQAGSPAGRLLETITTLVQRGAGTVGGVGAAAWGAGMGLTASAGQIAGAGGAFMAVPGTPYGPMGIGGGMLSPTAQTQMTAWQSLFTAYGGHLPFGLGKFAAQRMDMTREQARMMSQEELGSRMTGGWRRGVFGAANVATLGLVGLRARVTGTEMDFWRQEDIARDIQSRFRYLTAGALEEAGAGGFAGPFATGISRQGARAFTQAYSRQMGFLQREMGMTAEEVAVVGGRAMGTMGRAGIEQLFRRGGAEAVFAETGRQARAVRDIQQTLHLSEQEAQQFFDTIGQMHGTAERIAGIARGVRGMAGRLGLSTREIMDPLLQFERTGMQMGIGRGRGRAVAEQYIETLYGQFRRGGISAEQMMMYGGNTPEEALRLQAQTRFQQNLAMWAGGRGLMGVGVLAQDPGAWNRFMGGGAGITDIFGAVGGRMARDPYAALRARFDPRIAERMGMTAERAAYMLAQQATRTMTWLGDADRQALTLSRFSAISGLNDQEARTRAEQWQGEQFVSRQVARRMAFEGDENRHTQGIWSVYSQIVGQGAVQGILSATGAEDAYEAAGILYNRATKGGREEFDASKSLEDMLTEGADVVDWRERIETAEIGAVMRARLDRLDRGIKSPLSAAQEDTLRARARREVMGGLPGAQRSALIMARRRSILEILFPGGASTIGKTPEDLPEFAAAIASADTGETARLMREMGMSRLTAFAAAYDYNQQKGFRLAGTAQQVGGLVSPEALTSILGRAGYEYTQEQVEGLLGDRGTRGELELFRARLTKAPVVEEIFYQTQRSLDSVKMPILGTAGNPMVVLPASDSRGMTAWSQALNTTQQTQNKK